MLQCPCSDYSRLVNNFRPKKLDDTECTLGSSTNACRNQGLARIYKSLQSGTSNIQKYFIKSALVPNYCLLSQRFNLTDRVILGVMRNIDL